MSSSKSVLVVGAGFSGATIANRLAENGYYVSVIDSRDHIGGNAYDYINKNNIRIHKYGPHIFHTNSNKVIHYLSRFTEWNDYKHKVKAMLDKGQYVTLPPNLETISVIGEENVLDVLFRPYTKKMWGLDIEEIDASVLNRVPIRDDMNEYYFPGDSFQKLPKNGYTSLIKNMLDLENIEVSLNTEFEKKIEDNFSHVFNSMPIDEYYDYRFGELPYRSIKFESKTIPVPRLFPTATINLTNNSKYTRVTEWKNFPNHGENNHCTDITFEIPCDYRENNFERYYPVKDIKGENRGIYKQYLIIPRKKTSFIGRCGLYVYINMDQAVSSSLATADKFIKDNQ